jgi:hypothetical protein
MGEFIKALLTGDWDAFGPDPKAAAKETSKIIVEKYQFPFDKHYDDCRSYVEDGFLAGVEWAKKHY